MGDKISELPIDNFPPTSDEKDMIQWMFPPTTQPPSTSDHDKKAEVPISTREIPRYSSITGSFHLEIRFLFIIILLYLAVSNSYSAGYIQTLFPITSKNPIFLLVFQAFLFAFLLILFKWSGF